MRFPLLSNLYDQNGITDKKLRRDLNLFASSVALGMVFFSISMGTPFTGLAKALKANDLFYGLLFAVPIAMSFMQFFASWLLEKTRKRKTLFLIGGLTQRLLWIPVALVPLYIPADPAILRLWTVISLIAMATGAGSLMNISFMSWLADVLPMNIRGRYLGMRSSIATICGLTAALVASLVIDTIHDLNGYMLVFGVATLFGIGDIATFIWIRDPPMHIGEHHNFLSSMKNVVKDRSYVKYLIFWTAWIFCWNLSGPFFARYCMDVLNLNMTITTLTGQVTYGVLAFFSLAFWGKMLDRHSHRWVLYRAGLVASALPLIWLFASQGSFLPNLVFSMGTGLFVCAVDLTAMQMLVSVTPQRNRSSFVAMYMVVTSVLGASLGYLSGGSLLDLLDGVQFSLFGLSIDKYKLLFVGAGALRLLIILLLLPLIANLKPHNPEAAIVSEDERMEEHG
jgi:MFS family permease